MYIYNGTAYRVADGHAHIYPEKIAEKATASVGDFYDLQMENVGLPETLIKVGAEVGIEGYLVSSVATKAAQARAISEYIAAQCKKNPSFVGFAAYHQDLEDIDGEMDFIMSLGLKGIKLHPDFQQFNIDDEKMLPVYREAARRNIPVLFHTGDDRTDFSSPTRLARVFDKVQGFTAIAAHLGGYRRWNEARQTLKGSGVYIDTSSSLFYVSKEDAAESIRFFGADKTMFGTDFPMWTAKTELERFFALGLSEDENRNILWNNFENLFLK